MKNHIKSQTDELQLEFDKCKFMPFVESLSNHARSIDRRFFRPDFVKKACHFS